MRPLTKDMTISEVILNHWLLIAETKDESKRRRLRQDIGQLQAEQTRQRRDREEQ